MQTIDYQKLKAIQAENAATIINVLPADAFGKTYIPGAINIPLANNDFTEQVEKTIGSKTAPIVVYCASYSCDASKKAAQKLEQARFTNVMCYEGGAQEWQEKESRSAA